MTKIKNIVLIGAGNVGTQLGLAFQQAGFRIVQVYSKTPVSAKALAKKLKCDSTTSLKDLNLTADLYLIAVKDDAIDEISKKIKLKNKLVVHTSGSAEMKLLKRMSSSYGVIYPLQTFSKERKLNFQDIPFCIEGNTTITTKIIYDLAKTISGKVHKMDSVQRAAIHLAAIFACNFSNHMFAIAEKLLAKQGAKFTLLEPLIMETARKAITQGASLSQTGPAIRNDKKIIQKHLAMLKNDKSNKKIYRLLSKNIVANAK